MKTTSQSRASVSVPTKELDGIYERIRGILESAKVRVARTVNTTQVVANWLIGQEIVEGEQHGRKRAGYGDALLLAISNKLSAHVGKGWSVRQLEYCRAFYQAYPALLGDAQNSNALRSNFTSHGNPSALRSKSSESATIDEARQPWKPGRLSPDLSWTHFQTIIHVDSTLAPT